MRCHLFLPGREIVVTGWRKPGHQKGFGILRAILEGFAFLLLGKQPIWDKIASQQLFFTCIR